MICQNVFTFFYGGDSQKFVDALEFVGLSPINIEFAAFLLSDLGRQTMTKNKPVFMLNWEMFFTIIKTRERTFIVFCCLNRTTR